MVHKIDLTEVCPECVYEVREVPKEEVESTVPPADSTPAEPSKLYETPKLHALPATGHRYLLSKLFTDEAGLVKLLFRTDRQIRRHVAEVIDLDPTFFSDVKKMGFGAESSLAGWPAMDVALAKAFERGLDDYEAGRKSPEATSYHAALRRAEAIFFLLKLEGEAPSETEAAQVARDALLAT